MVKSSSSLPLQARPVVGFEDTYPAGYIDRLHSHEHGQLSFSVSGVVSVIAGDDSYVLPPDRAIWIPGNVPHQFNCRSEIHFLAVYVHPLGGNFPDHCRVFEVSPLVRGLVHEVTAFDYANRENERERIIAKLLLGEIERMPDLCVRALMPEDHRLQRVCNAIMQFPADQRGLDDWADFAGMGRRTFTRLFKRETGMGFATWRQQVRLMEAVSRLSAGEQISSIAYEVGYDSPSAFAAMFHRALGVPPREYRRPV